MNNNIQLILYQYMKSKYPEEQNLLFLLCQAPSGLSYTDVSNLVKLQPNHYGNWKVFLQEMIINEEAMDPATESLPETKSAKKEKDHGFRVIL